MIYLNEWGMSHTHIYYRTLKGSYSAVFTNAGLNESFGALHLEEKYCMHVYVYI